MKTEDIISIFKENGFKVTTQRLAICKLVLSRKDHPSTEDIYDLLKEDYPTISLGTIYKTLHLLEDLRLLQELNFSQDRIRYDPNMELHINIVCSKCGKIKDYQSSKLDSLWDTILTDLKVNPIGQRIDIYYECDDCKDL